MEQLQTDERGLLRAIRQVLPAGEAHELVLLIDQFEELFFMVPDREVTARFLDSLVAAVTDPYSPLRVIVTLRADFYDRPLLYPGLCDLMPVSYTHLDVYKRQPWPRPTWCGPAAGERRT